jgi:hypothetical protein
MPIAAGLNPLQVQLKNALMLKQSANNNLVATTIATAVATIAPMGIFPAGALQIPLAPAGYEVTKASLVNSFGLKQSANNDITSQLMASAFSMLCPIVPPIGLTTLQMLIKNALSLKQAANTFCDTVSFSIAQAIITYFMTGGVI